jgi:hypothetical protein
VIFLFLFSRCVGVKEAYKKPSFKVSIHPVLEYSLEFPYGRPARVWVNSETACYRIMSVSAEYGALWTPFYHMVNFAGHVVNVLINYTGKFNLVRFILRVSKLSKRPPGECLKLWGEHRKLIQDLLKGQNISSSLLRSHRALGLDSHTWTQSWENALRRGMNQDASLEELATSDLSSMPDISDPSSDDYSFIESKSSRSNSTSGSSRSSGNASVSEKSPIKPVASVNKAFSGVRLVHSAVPVQLESFQWQKEDGLLCPQCSLKFPTLVSFEVHLRGHLLSASSAKPAGLGERIDAFLKALNRLPADSLLPIPDALHFRKQLIFPAQPSASFLEPVKVLNAKTPKKQLQSAGTTDANAPKLSKKAKKRQNQQQQQVVVEGLNELSLQSASKVSSPAASVNVSISASASVSASASEATSEAASVLASLVASVPSSPIAADSKYDNSLTLSRSIKSARATTKSSKTTAAAAAAATTTMSSSMNIVNKPIITAKKAKIDDSLNQLKLPSLVFPGHSSSSSSQNKLHEIQLYEDEDEKMPLTAPLKRAVSISIDLTDSSSSSSSTYAKVEEPTTARPASNFSAPDSVVNAGKSTARFKFIQYNPDQDLRKPTIATNATNTAKQSNDSYVRSLRLFLSNSSENGANPLLMMNSSVKSSASACWNCFKSLPMDGSTGEALYPCPLCKVKKPIL